MQPNAARVTEAFPHDHFASVSVDVVDFDYFHIVVYKVEIVRDPVDDHRGGSFLITELKDNSDSAAVNTRVPNTL